LDWNVVAWLLYGGSSLNAFLTPACNVRPRKPDQLIVASNV